MKENCIYSRVIGGINCTRTKEEKIVKNSGKRKYYSK